MQNSVNLEKSRGVVVFAFNTHIDYVAIADQTSRLIEQHLGLPITLVTDVASDPKFNYDRVIRINNLDGSNFVNGDSTKQWRNFGRYLAYELSPYDETILLDTDYLVFDNSLLKLFSRDFDYQLMHHSYTPAGACPEQMGETSLPFVWATVVLFRKTERSRLFFDLVARIQRNYPYYRALYNVRERNFRNDYAFAIANNIISGYNLNESQGIPWPMLTIERPVERIDATEYNLRIYHNADAVVIPYQNIHIMDKQYLLSDNFKQLVDYVTA